MISGPHISGTITGRQIVVTVVTGNSGGGGGIVQQVVAGANVSVDSSNVTAPVVNADVGLSDLPDMTHVVFDNDPALTDARNPTVHAASHAAGGSDPVTVAQSQVTNLTADLGNKVDTSDGRLSDARTPTSHAATHKTAGSDPITPTDIGAADTNHTHDAADITSGLADVATSGLYSDLVGTPPTAPDKYALLTDVDTTGVADGDLMAWDQTAGLWKPTTPGGGGGVAEYARAIIRGIGPTTVRLGLKGNNVGTHPKRLGALRTPFPLTSDTLGVYVVTAQPSSLCGFVCYVPDPSDDAKWTLLFDEQIDTSTVGRKMVVLGGPVKIPAGYTLWGVYEITSVGGVAFWGTGSGEPSSLAAAPMTERDMNNIGYFAVSPGEALGDQSITVYDRWNGSAPQVYMEV